MRRVPAGTPGPVCHAGRGHTALAPPPLAAHPLSLCTPPAASRLSMLPPTLRT